MTGDFLLKPDDRGTSGQCSSLQSGSRIRCRALLKMDSGLRRNDASDEITGRSMDAPHPRHDVCERIDRGDSGRYPNPLLHRSNSAVH
ncbi:MAG: hypothetical protein J0H15_03575 [Xanthomonadales bacterium]|nr:hypothetical protein [Xanthomonadales bacterium]